MRKLLYTLDGAFLGEFAIDRPRIVIGRRPDSDIHIDNLSISGQHAVIVTTDGTSVLEDLQSTNGTIVNGQPVEKHVLQHGDLIELGKYQLRYVDGAAVNARVSGAVHVAHEVPPAPLLPEAEAAMPPPPQAYLPPETDKELGPACLHVMNGPNAGHEVSLDKVLTTLGHAGAQRALVTRRRQGYFISHLEGALHPLVNGRPIGAQAQALKERDVVVVGDVHMTFHGGANP